MKEFLRLFYAEDAGNDGGEPTPTTEPNPEPTKEPKMFTQEELNAINAKTKSAERAALLKELGIEGDPKNVKEALKAYKEAEEAKKSDLQKLQDSLKAEQEGKATLTQERDMAKAELEAIKAGCSPDKSDKLVKIAMTYEGETVADKVKAAMKDFPEFGKVQEKLDKFGNKIKNQAGNDYEALFKAELMKG